jgi:hypothetical protein
MGLRDACTIFQIWGERAVQLEAWSIEIGLRRKPYVA